MTEVSTLARDPISARPHLVLISARETEDDLLVSQLNFGWAYADEARLAFESGRSDYGRLALRIAVNAHSAVLRFTSCLPPNARRIFRKEIGRLQVEIARLRQQSSSVKSIA